jgi:hypothetical protein
MEESALKISSPLGELQASFEEVPVLLSLTRSENVSGRLNFCKAG